MARILAILLAGAFAGSVQASNPFWLEGKTDSQHEITVYRSATCGCCKAWIAHLKQHDFNVNDVTVEDVTPYKDQLGVPQQARSCHTAVVDGVTIEGHVPAQDIKRLLTQDHDVRLLAVPGMPSGSPGMDTPDAPSDQFRVFSVNQASQVGIFNEYRDY